MAVAYFTQHAPKGAWPIGNGGELAVLFCFIWLFFCVAGRRADQPRRAAWATVTVTDRESFC